MEARHRRRKALAPTTAALTSAFPEQPRSPRPVRHGCMPAPASPQRRVRAPPRAHHSDYFDYFDDSPPADISLTAPAPNIDFPVREGVPRHWEYASSLGLLAAPTARHALLPPSSSTPCQHCVQRVSAADLPAADMHLRCVLALRRQSPLPRAPSRYAPRAAPPDPRVPPRPSANAAYECDHPACAHHCALRPRHDLAHDDPPADGGGSSSSADGSPRAAPPRALPHPYSVSATLHSDDSSMQIGDVTAAQAAAGKDVQGIPWENLPFSREDYRATRMRETPNREARDAADAPNSAPNSAIKEPSRDGRFFSFFQNTRRVKCSIVHFQLRNLAWAASKHDVLVMHEAGIVHWDAAARLKRQVLDLSGSSSAVNNGLPMVQISTIIARDGLAIAGGFYGEVVARNLHTGKLVHNQRITHDENAITNAFDMFDGLLMASSNDSFIRCYDLNTFQRSFSIKLDNPVNHATRQQNGKLICAVGDDHLVHVLDSSSSKLITQLSGHEEYSFATWWHPNSVMFATGSQDKTCRIWDVRNMSRSLYVLGAHTSAVRALRFSTCGRFLAMSEQKDFVHIYDVRNDFETCQEIDLFGEIGGVSFTPASEALFIAVSDRAYSSLMEYQLNPTKGFFASDPTC